MVYQREGAPLPSHTLRVEEQDGGVSGCRDGNDGDRPAMEEVGMAVLETELVRVDPAHHGPPLARHEFEGSGRGTFTCTNHLLLKLEVAFKSH